MLRPWIWLLSWAARSSQRSARAGEAPSVAMAMAASSVSAAATRADPKPADPKPADLSLEIGAASCCFVMDTPRAIETRGRFMDGLPNRAKTCLSRIGYDGRHIVGGRRTPA